MIDNKEKLNAITAYWQDIGILRVHDTNGDSHIGRPSGFFNGFFILNTIEGGRVWIDVDNIVSIKEMGILIRGEPV